MSGKLTMDLGSMEKLLASLRAAAEYGSSHSSLISEVKKLEWVHVSVCSKRDVDGQVEATVNRRPRLYRSAINVRSTISIPSFERHRVPMLDSNTINCLNCIVGYSWSVTISTFQYHNRPRSRCLFPVYISNATCLLHHADVAMLKRHAV